MKTSLSLAKILPVLATVLLPINHLMADGTNSAPAAATAPAPTGKVLAPTNDVSLGSDGEEKDPNSYQARIGELYAPGGSAYILPIRIPALPEGQHFDTVHLRVQLVAINNEADGLANVDLYGLGVRETEKAVAADYYQGTAADPKATLIQAKFLTPKSAVRTDAITGPFVETSAEADKAFAKYFNEVCSKPGNAGKYLLLRLSYTADTIPNGNNAYLVLTTGASGEEEPPIITYTLAPGAAK